MSYKVTLRLDPARVDSVVGGLAQDAVRNAANVAQGLASGIIRDEGRVDTGRMAEDIEIGNVEGSALQPTITVTATAPYSAYQEYGTRAHGPVRAKFLVFTPKGSSKKVFAKWVRGVTGIHFMRRAAQLLKPSDFSDT